MKKVLALLLAVVIFAGVVVTGNAKLLGLEFREDGKFTIIHMADCQDGFPSNKEMFEYINYVLDEYKPDLVILGGDNTVGSKETKEEAIKELVTPFVEHETNFALVFGNHDHQFESDCEERRDEIKEYLLSLYQKYGGKYCVSYDFDEELTGVGTQAIPVYGSDGKTIKYCIYLFDSNTYDKDENGNDTGLGYDCVHPDQIEWYKEKRESLKTLTGNYVPSVAFQHIIVGDVYDYLYYKAPFDIGLCESYYGNYYTYIPKTENFTGYVNEPPCPGYRNYGQLAAMAEKGDTKGIFSGHDHTNDFEVVIDGVRVINTPSITYNSYSSELNRGARLIVLDEKTGSFESTVIKVNDIAAEDEDYAAKVGTNKFVAGMYVFFDKILMGVQKFVRIFTCAFNTL